MDGSNERESKFLLHRWWMVTGQVTVGWSGVVAAAVICLLLK